MSGICLKTIKSPIFETITLIIIVWNSIILALDNPNQIEETEQIFLILYTIEMGLKIFAMGFVFNTKSYLRDYWNLLDFIIVSTGYLPLVLKNSSHINLTALRSLRILRPLRTISSIKNLKFLIKTLFEAFPMLIESVFLLLFFILIFSIAGIQIFSG